MRYVATEAASLLSVEYYWSMSSNVGLVERIYSTYLVIFTRNMIIRCFPAACPLRPGFIKRYGTT